LSRTQIVSSFWNGRTLNKVDSLLAKFALGLLILSVSSGLLSHKVFFVFIPNSVDAPGLVFQGILLAFARKI
jgi:hypothetical protein